ncbi:MAG: hypothetical protein J0I18_13820 [Actinobacteria bacterium]|nr:hypothetical protein [Actinomycetota bacterium]
MPCESAASRCLHELRVKGMKAMGEREAELRRTGTRAGISRRAIIGASAWAVPAIVAVTSTPAAAVSAVPSGPVFIPPQLSGIVGGGWSIATRFDTAKRLPTGQPRTAIATATSVPVTVSPPKATNVTITITGAGFAVYKSGDNVAFTPTQSIVVNTGADGLGLFHVAIPPLGMGDRVATITATGNGSVATATLTTGFGNVYTIGGRTAQGQAMNGTSLGSLSYPTPWMVDGPLAGVYASRSTVLAIAAAGTVFGGGDNSSAELGMGTNVGSTLAPRSGLKDDGSPFTDAARCIASQSGTNAALYVIEDRAGNWWGAGRQEANVLAIPGDVTSARAVNKFTRIGGSLPGRPVWVSLFRNDAMIVWTLEDGTVWFTGDATKFAKLSKGLPAKTGSGVVQQLLYKDGTPVTGIAKAVQADDWTLMMLTTDGRVLFSGTATASYTPGGYVDDGYAHEIQGPPGDLVEIWAHQPTSAYATSFYIKNATNELWAVGGNSDGTLANGTTVATQNWTRVLVDDVKEISTGNQHILILDNSGDVWFAGTNFENCWGMGTGGPTKVTTPVKITTIPPHAKTIASTWQNATVVAY